MCIAYYRMEECEALPISPKESSESVLRQVSMHALGEHEQARSQPPLPQAPYPLFMQEFM